jgi:hypothetical protein
MKLQVNVVVSTPTIESANVIAEHIIGLGEEDSHFTVYKEPKLSEEDDDEFKVVIALFIAPDNLDFTLITLDGIKAGYTTPSETMVFSDEILRNIGVFPILDGANGGTIAANQLNRYMSNKIQEQAKAIAVLEAEAAEQGRQFVKIAKILQGHQERYESMQAYIHSYIDLTNMAKIVTALAEEIDSDLLEQYSMAVIH